MREKIEHTFCSNKPNTLTLAPISEAHCLCKRKYGGKKKKNADTRKNFAATMYFIPDLLVMASLFPFRDEFREPGEEERDFSVGLLPIDFCRFNGPAEVPLTGLVFIPQLPWPER